MKKTLTGLLAAALSLAASAAPAQKPPGQAECRKILRAEYESWIAKHPRSSNRFFNLRSSQDELLCRRCQEETGKKLAGWIAAEGTAVDTNEKSPYVAGCVGFRPDLFASQAGAECIIRFLGEGYYLSGSGGTQVCSIDGLPYTITPRTTWK